MTRVSAETPADATHVAAETPHDGSRITRHYCHNAGCDLEQDQP
jgi:hypothetical protein